MRVGRRTVHCLRVTAQFRVGPEEISRQFALNIADLDRYSHQLHTTIATPLLPNLDGDIASRNWYKAWTETVNGVLHIYGPPGSGTTLFASRVLANLRSGNKIALSFSVNSRYQKNKHLAPLFISLCRQALLTSKSLNSSPELCKWLRRQTIFSKDAFKGLLRSILSFHLDEPVFCIIHAIDNYDASLQKELLGDLNDVRASALSSQNDFKLLFTSHKLEITHEKMKADKIVHVHDELRAMNKLEQVVKAHLADMAQVDDEWESMKPESLKRLWREPATLFEVSQRLVYLKGAEIPSGAEAKQTCVDDMPLLLRDLYRRIMYRLEVLDYNNIATWTIPWIMFALRPLSLPELAVIIAMEESSANATMETLRRSIRSNLRNELENLLGQLIHITDQRVEISHSTYLDYMQELSSCPEDPHLYLLTRCAEYVRKASKGWNKGNESERENRFADYAACLWPLHYRLVLPQNLTKASSIAFGILGDKDVFVNWRRMFDYHIGQLPSQMGLPTTPVEFTSWFGFAELIGQFQPSNGTNNDRDIKTAFDFAAESGMAETIRCLARLGAPGQSSLLKVARNGDVATLEVLLEINQHILSLPGEPAPKGAEVLTPLHEAAQCGHLAVVRLLLDPKYQVDVDAVSSPHNLTALHMAARIGQSHIVRALKEANASLDAVDNKGYDALAFAAQGGFGDVITTLLDRNASALGPETNNLNVNRRNAHTNDTALHIASSCGHLGAVKTLLDRNADHTLKNKRGYTPLHSAAEKGFYRVAEVLVAAISTVGGAENTTLLDSAVIQPTATPSQTAKGEQDIPTDHEHTEGEESQSGSSQEAPGPLELAVVNEHAKTMRVLLDSSTKDGLCKAIKQVCKTGNEKFVYDMLLWYKESHPNDPILADNGGNTALHWAAEYDQPQLFTALSDLFLWDHYPPNLAQYTPLHTAAESGSYDTLIFLVRRSTAGEMRMTTGEGKTALHLAAQSGNFATVVLLYYRIPVLTRSKDGKTAADLAAEHGHGDVLGFLLHENEELATGPMLQACVRNRWRDVINFFPKGILDWQDKSGDTALHLAATLGSDAEIKALVDAGADVNLRNTNYYTPFMSAVQAQQTKGTNALLEATDKISVDDLLSNGITPLLHVCKYANGDEDELHLVRELLKRDANVNARWPDENATPLHSAAEKSKPALLRCLLESKEANPDVMDKCGIAPIHIAARKDTGDFVNALLGASIPANPDIRADRELGLTALHIAARYGCSECIKALIDGKANKEETKTEVVTLPGYKARIQGITPLSLAVACGKKDAVDILLEKGAKVGRSILIGVNNNQTKLVEKLLPYAKPEELNYVDEWLGTPIFQAVDNEYDDMIRLLLNQNDLNPDQLDSEGRTALSHAVIYGKESMVSALLGKSGDVAVRANPNVEDREKRLPLVRAIMSRDIPLVTVLSSVSKLDHIDGRGNSPLYWASRDENDDDDNDDGDDGDDKDQSNNKDDGDDAETIFNTINAACADLSNYSDLCSLALHAAIASNRMTFLKALLSVPGIDINAKDSDGWTPLYTAKRYKRSKMEKLLRNETTKTTKPTPECTTAWHSTDHSRGLSVWTTHSNHIVEVKSRLSSFSNLCASFPFLPSPY